MDKSKLEDVLNYEMEEYLSKDEMGLIRATFRSPRVMKVLRKVFIPTIADPELPIEQIGNDMWMVGRKWDQIPAAEKAHLVSAREDAIKFIMNGLVRLSVLANSKEETAVEKSARISKDSTR